MKKLMSVFLSVIFVFSTLLFSGCSGELSINELIEKTAALDAVEAVLKTNVTVGAGSMSMSIPMTVNMKAKNMTSTSPVVWANMSTSFLGIDEVIETYAEGEYIYVKTALTNYKTNIIDLDGEFDYVADFDSMLKTIPEDVLAETEIKKNDDGTRSITVSLSNEKFAEIFGELAEDLAAEISESEENDNLAFAGATLTVVVADSYVKKYEIKFNMNVDMMGLSMSAEATCSLEIVKTGNDVTITPPEGYQDFEDWTINFD